MVEFLLLQYLRSIYNNIWLNFFPCNISEVYTIIYGWRVMFSFPKVRNGSVAARLICIRYMHMQSRERYDSSAHNNFFTSCLMTTR